MRNDSRISSIIVFFLIMVIHFSCQVLPTAPNGRWWGEDSLRFESSSDSASTSNQVNFEIALYDNWKRDIDFNWYADGGSFSNQADVIAEIRDSTVYYTTIYGTDTTFRYRYENSYYTASTVSWRAPQNSGSYEVGVMLDGVEKIFKTIHVYVSVTDIDGNEYKTTQIGDQLWMAENLKVTHYRDGTAIPNLTSDSDWSNTSSGAYCYFDNNSSNGDTYGALYNWYAVTDARNISPEGWHVPSDDEWKELEMYLGMSQTEADDIHSRSSNVGSKLGGGWNLWLEGNLRNNTEFNTSGFSVLPAGSRYHDDGSFSNVGESSHFWSTTTFVNNSAAYFRGLYCYFSGVYRHIDSSTTGHSVRCVRD